MRWFCQKSNYGLGNFIMATPALRLLSEQRRAKVNVFFETEAIASLYKKCPFISIIKDMPEVAPFASNVSPRRRGDESESHAFCRIITGMKDFVMPDTYVDYDPSEGPNLKKVADKKYVAFFHGCLGTYWLTKKDIGRKLRQSIIRMMLELELIPVILGTKKDYQNYWNKNDLKGCLNYLGRFSLRETVNLLGQCDFTVSNDTGLYHVAGALKKRGLVLWKQTDMTKNMTTATTIKHISVLDRNIEKKVYGTLKNESSN